MKYVITGSLGHNSKPLVQNLVKSGNEVHVITSKDERRTEIEELGGVALIGSVTDVAFLKTTFLDADAVYTMVPPFYAAPDRKKYIAETVGNYVEALKGSSVKHVVNLSSIGAHMPEGCGPVSGLYHGERALNELGNIHVLHLRPAYFYYNFFSQINLIRNAGFIGGNYGPSAKLILSDTEDIAQVATQALLNLSFTGKSWQYIASDEKTTEEVASILGSAIGKPELKWVDFTDEQSLSGMVQAGLPQNVAENFTEMGVAIRTGEMISDYLATGQKPVGKIKMKDFAAAFARAYHAQEKVLS